MRNLIVVFSFLLSVNLSFAQNEDHPNLTYLLTGGGEHYGGHNFKLEGSESQVMFDALLSKFPESKKRGSFWKVKNIEVPGIKDPITFKIYQGTTTKGENGKGSFSAFKSEKEKETKSAQKNESENTAIVIYVDHGRKQALKTIEQAEIVKEYLISVYLEKNS